MSIITDATIELSAVTESPVGRVSWLVFGVAVAAVWLYTAAFEQPPLTSVRVFTALSVGAYVFVLWWAAVERRGDSNQWHYFWVLLVGTLFWYVGESVAIRLGKYEYASFPLAIPSLLGGTFDQPDTLARLLYRINPQNAIRNPLSACHAGTWSIPFPVVAFESVLLFSMWRVASLRLAGRGFKAALGAAAQSALLLTSLTAVLDPTVSRTNECIQNSAEVGRSALQLWTWFTTDIHRGYWFGVPLVNYISWLCAAFVFTLLVRWDDERPGGIVKKYDALLKYVGAALIFLGIQLIACYLVKASIDQVLDRRPAAIEQRTWQFAVFAGAFFSLGVYLRYRYAHLRRRPKTDWISVFPMLTTHLLSLFALSLNFRWPLFAIWLASAAFLADVLFRPRRGEQAAEPS